MLKKHDLLKQLSNCDSEHPVYVYLNGIYYPIVNVEQDKDAIKIVCRDIVVRETGK
jgi:hypothetical protein